MKKLLFLLLFIPLFSFSQSYPLATKAWEWGGTISAAAVRVDTVVQYTGSNEAAGLYCTCSFDFKALNRDSSIIRMGGSDIVLASGTPTYYKWSSYGATDSVMLRKALYKQVYHARGGAAPDTSYIYTVKINPYGFLKPQFQWKKNGKVSSGTLTYKCMFSRN
jgi:hypothetical protein